ncbi:MAG: hypothetical protein L0I76_08530 [Pseudonocardia sp.]|nr:hypothetical protein [Pseudonocardia sp.]
MVMWRAVLRWLMHSPMRFALVVVGAAVVVIVLAQLGGSDSAPPAAAQPAPSTTGEPAATAPTTTTAPPAPSTTSPPPALPSSPRAAAEEFARLWAAPDVPRSEWLTRLEPLTTEEYSSVGLAQVDPANVPARAVAGPATVVEESTGAATVRVPLDAVTIVVQLVNEGPGWRVAEVQPASES